MTGHLLLVLYTPLLLCVIFAGVQCVYQYKARTVMVLVLSAWVIQLLILRMLPAAEELAPVMPWIMRLDAFGMYASACAGPVLWCFFRPSQQNAHWWLLAQGAVMALPLMPVLIIVPVVVVSALVMYVVKKTER